MQNVKKSNYRIWCILAAIFIALSALPLGNALAAGISGGADTTSSDEPDNIQITQDTASITAPVILAEGIPNNEISISGDYDYVYLGDGSIGVATEDIAQIEVDFGGGTAIFTSMQKGERYYGRAYLTNANLKDYPQITHTVHLDVSDSLKDGKVFWYSFSPAYQVYTMDVHTGNFIYLGPNTYTQVPPYYTTFDYSDDYWLAFSKLDEPLPEKHSVFFYANAAAAETDDLVYTKAYYPGEPVEIIHPEDFPDKLYRDGYVFAGWNRKPDGTITYYGGHSATSILYMGNEDIKLYAQWIPEDALVINGMNGTGIPLKEIDGSSLENMTLSAGAVVRCKLDESMFIWKGGKSRPLSVQLLYWNTLEVKTRAYSGAKAFEKIAFEEDVDGNVYVAIRFKPDSGGSVSEDVEFKYEIYFTHNKFTISQSATVITGIISLPAANNGGDSGDNGGGSSNGSGDSDNGGGGGGGSSGGGGGIAAFNPTGPAPVTGPVKVSDATNAVQKALAAAKQSGAASATVSFKNVSELPFEAVQAMIKAAGNTSLKVHADSTLNNGNVDVRISFDPAKATKGVNLSASTVSNRAQSIKSFFAKWFINKTQIISFAQQGDWGMPVEAAIKLDKELDSKTLLFYSYDKATNAYKQISNPNYRVDANGYVHFTTTLAGDIVITDKPLSRK